MAQVLTLWQGRYPADLVPLMMILLVLLVLGGYALHTLKPDERTRLKERLVATASRARKEAARRHAQPEPFRDALRERTPWPLVMPALLAVNVLVFLMMGWGSTEQETLVGTLHYGSVLCVTATMGYKHREIDLATIAKGMAKPAFMIKIIPHVDCTPRICELVRYYMEDVQLKGAWTGPAALQLFEHAMCDVARLPVREVVSASHYIADLTLGLGEVVYDYLK